METKKPAPSNNGERLVRIDGENGWVRTQVHYVTPALVAHDGFCQYVAAMLRPDLQAGRSVTVIVATPDPTPH